MSLSKSLAFFLFLLVNGISFSQNKKEQLAALENRNDSLQLLNERYQKELDQLVEEQKSQVETQQKLTKSMQQLGMELTSVQKDIEGQKNEVVIKEEQLQLLKQLNITADLSSDSMGIYFKPIKDVLYQNEKITIIQYNKEKKQFTYVSGDMYEKVQDLSNWTFINSDDIEFQQKKLQKACGCQLEQASLYDLLKFQESYSIPEAVIKNGVFFTKDGTLYLDHSEYALFYFNKFEAGKPKNKTGYVFFVKTIQL